MPSRTRFLTVTGLLALVLSAPTAGCRRPPARKPGATDSAGRTPRQTIVQLVQWREAQDYGRIQPLIVPERGADVIAALVAVDAFLQANAQLCERVTRAVGSGLAQVIDQSYLAYDLEIFSKYVEVLDETISDDVASVAFLVDRRLPAQTARLVRLRGRWHYDPGPGDYRGLSQAFGRMAQGLRDVEAEIEQGRLTTAVLAAQPERLQEEVRLRLTPGLKLLPPRPAAPDGK